MEGLVGGTGGCRVGSGLVGQASFEGPGLDDRLKKSDRQTDH